MRSSAMFMSLVACVGCIEAIRSSCLNRGMSGRRDDLRVFYAIAQFPAADHFVRRLERIQHLAVRGIADRVHVDLVAGLQRRLDLRFHFMVGHEQQAVLDPAHPSTAPTAPHRDCRARHRQTV